MSSDRPGEARRLWAEALAEQLTARGVTQDQLAEQCGVSAPLVRKWLAGRTLPGRGTSWLALQAALPELPAPPWKADDDQAGGAEDEPQASVDLAARVRELEELTQRLEAQATIDALTGVLNKRGIRDALERTVHAAHRRGESVAVAVLDLDKFKAINDGHGHAAGDEVLKAFAATVAGSIRKGDSFGRDGGEEFLLIYENSNLQAARIQAERVRQRVEELEINGLRITVSIGVAALQAPKDNRLADEQCKELCAELVKRADWAVYCAKEDGRNRVDFWEKGRDEARAARKAREAAAVTGAKRAPAVPPTLLPRMRTGLASTRLREVAFCFGILFLGGSFGAEGGCFAPTPPPVPTPPPGGKDAVDD